MKRAKLSEVAQINPRLPKGLDEAQPVSFLSMASVSETGKVLFQETRKLAETKKGYTYFERGDILLAKITPCFENGKAAHVSDLEHPIGFGSTEFHVLRPDPERLDAKYLFFLVWNKRLRYLGQKAMKGAAGQKRVPNGFLENYDIPLPALDDQKRIAHLFGKVEGLIAKRKQHLQQLDDLLKSVFREMFGDPVRNEKGWDTKTLPNLILPHKNALKRGPFGGALKKEIFVDSGYLIYEQNHALNGDYSFQRYFIDENKYRELADFKVEPGDILISCSGVYLGKLSIVPQGALPGIINQALLKVSLNKEEMRQTFFIYLFGSPQIKNKYFPSNRGGAIPNLPPMSDMKKIEFICPPINIQDQFVAIVEKIGGIKSRYQKNLTGLENLYGALSQKAFKGELELSRVTLLPEQESYVAREQHERELAKQVEQNVPENINATLTNLNALNATAERLKSIADISRLATFDLVQQDALRAIAEKMASLRSPLQELKQIDAITEAMERAQAVLKPLNLEHIDALTKSVELAHTITASLPHIDMTWLEHHTEAVQKAAEPFESMRKAMERIVLPTLELPDSMRLASEAARRLQSSIPDFSAWQQSADLPGAELDDEERRVKRRFTREDLNAIFAQSAGPLSSETLLNQLNELETVDLSGYETIKAILFDLLAEQRVSQEFDEKTKSLLLAAHNPEAAH